MGDSETEENEDDEKADYDGDEDDDEDDDDDDDEDEDHYSIEYDDNNGDYDYDDADVPDNVENCDENDMNVEEANGPYKKKDQLTTHPVLGKPPDQSTNNNGRAVESKRNASSAAKNHCEDKYHLEAECAPNCAEARTSKNSTLLATTNDNYKSEKQQELSRECSGSICSDKEDPKVS